MRLRSHWSFRYDARREINDNVNDTPMTQDERWLAQWQDVIGFLEANKRRPSKFVDSEHGLRNWWKHQQKLLNAGELKSDRIEKFNKLLELGERYKHINQYK